jgi:two-component SAPR family response regulator
MNHFLLVGQADGNLKRYSELLQSNHGITITHVELGQEALKLVSDPVYQLIIVDEKLGDYTGLEFIEMVVQVNPMVLCALVSSMAAKEFHDSSEGLGVLSQLPAHPTSEDIDDVLQKVSTVLGLN